jgi:hypothetical protein
MAKRPIVKLDEWAVYGVILIGDAYGHPKFPNGTKVQTSEIQKVYWVNGPRIKTRNTIYQLIGRNTDPKVPCYIKDNLIPT